MTTLTTNFSHGAYTTVAAGSSGGEISAIASWSSPSGGVLDVATTTGFPSSGTLQVAASGSTVGVISYTGTSGGNSFTGCTYFSGSPLGTVSTGGTVSLQITACISGPVQAAGVRLSPKGRVYSNPGSLPALLLTNNFDGGSNTTTISTGNSGGTSGHAFDQVSIGGTDTLTFSNTTYASGSLSAKVANGTAGNTNVAIWLQNSIGSQPAIWFRLCMFWSANPGSTCQIFRLLGASGTTCGGIGINFTGTLFMVNSVLTTELTSANVIPLNQWFRVEGYVYTSQNGKGTLSFSLFATPEAQVPFETQTATGQSTGPAVGNARFGFPGNTTSVTYYLDSIGLSNTGYLGPVSYTADPSSGMPGSAIQPRIPRNSPRGRISSNPGGPLQNPPTGVGPVFRQATSPCRAPFPPPHPPAGRIGSSQGAPVKNPNPGPPSYPLEGPIRAKVPQHPRTSGYVNSSPGAPVRNPVSSGPAFYPKVTPSRAPIPQTFSKGRCISNQGAAVHNPTPGPVFRQKTSPARAPFPPPHPPAGRIGSNQGAPVKNPNPGPPVYPLQGPVRGRLPQLHPRCGYANSNHGAPLRNPTPGPVFRQAVHPIRAVIPQNAPRGRTGSNPGGPIVFPRSQRFKTGIPYFPWQTGSPEAG